MFKGTHDFVAFRGAFRGNERGKIQDTICTMFDVSICEEEGGKEKKNVSMALCKTYCIDITGDRFLYKQVRFLVGAIVQYATNASVTKNDIVAMLESGDWGNSDDDVDDSKKQPFQRFCAPPHGLCLKKVEYEAAWDFEWTFDKAKVEEASE